MKGAIMKELYNDTYDVAVCGGGFAGISAALAAALTDDFSTLDVCVLQERLRKSGVVLHEREPVV